MTGGGLSPTDSDPVVVPPPTPLYIHSLGEVIKTGTIMLWCTFHNVYPSCWRGAAYPMYTVGPVPQQWGRSSPIILCIKVCYSLHNSNCIDWKPTHWLERSGTSWQKITLHSVQSCALIINVFCLVVEDHIADFKHMEAFMCIKINHCIL